MPTVHAETLAAELHRLAEPAGPPFDMEAIASSLGYAVEWVDPARIGSAEGFCLHQTLFVKFSDSPGRRAWTLAHELAHAEAFQRKILHDEVFVDRCAAELLMPRHLITLAAFDLPRLAERFAVSLEAAGRRVVDVHHAMLAVVDRGENRRARRIIHSPHGPPPTPVAVAAASLARRAARTRTPHEANVGDWRLGAWLTAQSDRAICLAARIEQLVLD